MMEENRKTGIPIKGIPEMVEWLLKNCSEEEITFMRTLAADRGKFLLLNSIFTRLTDFNVHRVFYEKNIRDGQELLIFRAAARGEVAGLKAFSMACQAAGEYVSQKKKAEQKIKRKQGGD